MRTHCAIVLGLLLALPSCINFSYSRSSMFEPIPKGATDQLSPGAELQTCLDTLGAPIAIWETPLGMTLAYGWRDQGAWAFEISYSLQDFVAIRFNYSSNDLDLNGVVLQFDGDYRLKSVRRGYLADLAPSAARRRPANQVED